MNNLLEKMSKLVDVKSIVTLMIVLVFCYLAIVGRITGDQFLIIVTTVISFYFGTQHQKSTQEVDKNEQQSID